MNKIIRQNKNIIPACDVPIMVLTDIVRATADIDGIGGYKIPAVSGRKGWERWVEAARKYTNKPLIYDHQKAGTDIPDTGQQFMKDLKGSGFDAVILFPLAGPVSQYEWTKAAENESLGVIVGGEMTHQKFLDYDFFSNNKVNYDEIFEKLGFDRPLTGYLKQCAPDEIYELAARMGIVNFVVPGNKPAQIRRYNSLIKRRGIAEPIFWSPGLIAQGGDLTDSAKAAGENFHAIVGRELYWNFEANDYKTRDEIRETALELTSKL